jgi:hypothetical protein
MVKTLTLVTSTENMKHATVLVVMEEGNIQTYVKGNVTVAYVDVNALKAGATGVVLPSEFQDLAEEAMITDMVRFEDAVQEENVKVDDAELGIPPEFDYARVPFEKPTDKAEKYGCHCDLDDGQQPDRCVIDDGNLDGCVYARTICLRGRSKTDCRYWLKITNPLTKVE